VKSFTCAGGTENFTYDSDGLLTGAGRFSISRNAENGLPVSAGDGTLNLSRTFSGYGETAPQTVAAGTQNLSQISLTRDNAGRITAKTGTSGGVTSDYLYTYDAAGRLLTVTKNGVLTEEYRYNANGSRVYEMNTLRGIAGRSMAYSAEDHLLTAGGVTYTYSPDGFLTGRTAGAETTTYDYSSRGELMGVTLPGGTSAEYVHDPLGRRIAKKVNGAVTEKYLWSGLTTLLAVYDGNNNLLMRFEYADSRMPSAVMKAGVLYYMAYDQVGSLKLVADSAGNVVKRVEYDTFGNIISDSAPLFQIPFGFAGGLHDRDTGLVRFGYRDYDSETGRWTAKDPIGFAGGDTDLYGYCLNDPVNWADPWGLASITVYSENREGSSSSSSFYGYGHSWVKITNDDGTSVQKGAYPGGLVEDDYALTSTPEYTWNITQTDADAATQAVKDFGNWALFNNNCVDLTEDVLKAAGIKHPNFDTWGVSDPANVYKWLNDLNKKNSPCK